MSATRAAFRAAITTPAPASRWTTIRVDPQPSRRANVMPIVAGLGAVTLAALVVIWLLPRWWATESNPVGAEDRMPILETR